MLSAILSYAHLTKLKVPEHSTASSYLDEIQKAGERSSDLIRQLLTFSRQQVIEPRVLDLNELILGLEKMLRRLIDESIELVMVLDNDPTPVKADPGQLEQILVNMIVNARDAMPDGGSIFVETIAEVAGDETGTRPANINLRECVLIKISDTGVGITDDQKAHIFEPFYTTKDVGKGTGLGLATCYGIVTQSGGSITVDSKPGQGTTFNMFSLRSNWTNGRMVRPDLKDHPSAVRTSSWWKMNQWSYDLSPIYLKSWDIALSRQPMVRKPYVS